MSTVFLSLAKHWRPGVYRLPEPVELSSEMNFWEETDWRAGGCKRADIGRPIRYRLHVVLVRNSHEWYGFDEPLRWHHPVLARAHYNPADAAVAFAPGDLSTPDLLRFLRTARRVCGPARTWRGKAPATAAVTQEGGDVSC